MCNFLCVYIATSQFPLPTFLLHNTTSSQSIHLDFGRPFFEQYKPTNTLFNTSLSTASSAPLHHFDFSIPIKTVKMHAAFAIAALAGLVAAAPQSVVYKTDLVTVTSCGPDVSN